MRHPAPHLSLRVPRLTRLRRFAAAAAAPRRIAFMALLVLAPAVLVGTVLAAAGPSPDVAPAALPKTAGAAAAAPAASPAPAASHSRHPAALAGEQAFFAAFNDGAMPPEAPLTPLMGAYASDPTDARTQLLLGLDHLWLAAEGDRSDPRVIEHLILSEHFLRRARELDPSDERIPSWLVPVRLSLAQIEGDAQGRAAILADLYAAYEKDPAFHSFTVALLGFQSPVGSAAFERGLAALRAVEGEGVCPPDDVTCMNTPRWPHNLEGFVSFYADYELKAGHPEQARRLLAEMQAEPSFADWPYRDEAQARVAHFAADAARFGDDDPANDPRPVALTRSCSACHRAR